MPKLTRSASSGAAEGNINPAIELTSSLGENSDFLV